MTPNNTEPCKPELALKYSYFQQRCSLGVRPVLLSISPAIIFVVSATMLPFSFSRGLRMTGFFVLILSLYCYHPIMAATCITKIATCNRSANRATCHKRYGCSYMSGCDGDFCSTACRHNNDSCDEIMEQDECDKYEDCEWSDGESSANTLFFSMIISLLASVLVVLLHFEM